MFSGKFIFLKGPNRLFTKTQLQSVDIVYKAQPFVNVVSKTQETTNLDVVTKSQPFYGAK